MKNYVLYEILKRLRENPNRKKVLTRLALIGVFAFVSMGTLAVWAGVKTLGYITEVTQNSKVQLNMDQLKTETQQRTDQFSFENCWNSAKNLLRLQPWIEEPVGTHLKGLRIACFENQETPPCQDSQCTPEPQRSATQPGKGTKI